MSQWKKYSVKQGVADRAERRKGLDVVKVDSLVVAQMLDFDQDLAIRSGSGSDPTDPALKPKHRGMH